MQAKRSKMLPACSSFLTLDSQYCWKRMISISLTAVVRVDTRVVLVDSPFLRITRRHSSRSDNLIVRTPDGACLEPSRDYDLRPRLRLRPNHSHHFPAVIHLVLPRLRHRYRRRQASPLSSTGWPVQSPLQRTRCCVVPSRKRLSTRASTSHSLSMVCS
jgi:hypothetical protein